MVLEMNIDDFPAELLIQIFDSLEFQDVIQCSLVCRRFNNIVMSNFSKFHLGWRSVSDVAMYIENEFKSHGAIMFAKSNPIVAFHEDRTEVHEFHPFSKRFYHTATTKKIVKAYFDFKTVALIPTTSLLVYSRSAFGREREPSLMLAVCDLKKDREIARHPLPSWPSWIIASRGCICLVNCPGPGDLSLYSWDGAELALLRVVKSIGDNRTMSKSEVRRIQECRQLPGFSCINCHFPPVDELEAADRNLETAVGLSGLRNPDAADCEIHDKIHVTIRERVHQVSNCGRLLITQRECSPFNDFAIYNTESKQVVLRFHVPEDFFYFGRQPFFEDPRYLLLRHRCLLVVDIEQKKILRIPIAQRDYFSCSVCCDNGDSHVKIINKHSVEMHKIDETAVGWEALD